MENNLKLQTELEHQFKTAVDIINNLTAQNEDLLNEKEIYFGSTNSEIKILKEN